MKTKEFTNNSENLMPELLKGFAEAHKELVTLGEDHMTINNRLAEADRVTIVTQGRSDHEPAINGFMGEGTADTFVAGDVFVAPEPQACLDAIKLADKGKDILYIVLNHVDNMLTGNLAMKKCAKKGLDVVEIVTQEDIVSAPRLNVDDRRGLVGYIPICRITGAATAGGESLEEVTVITQRLADNMATLAVAISGATYSATGSLLVNLGEDEMEIGMGQHGEGDGERQTMRSANETTKIMLSGLLADLDIREGEKIMLILNGTGATILMELFITYRRCVSCLKEKNIKIVFSYMGGLLAVQGQTGSQMFTARVDDEFLHYWNVSCSTPYIKK